MDINTKKCQSEFNEEVINAMTNLARDLDKILKINEVFTFNKLFRCLTV